MKNTFAFGKFLLSILVLGIISIQAQNTQQPVLFNFEPNSKAAGFTEKDRDFALKYLKETQAEFLKAVSGLSEEQFNFKPDPKKWSVAEVAEHIIVVETRLLPTITEKILKNPAPEGKDFYRVVDGGIIMAITNRTTKLQAPEAIQPKGRWSLEIPFRGQECQ
jgi:DinB superfamily